MVRTSGRTTLGLIGSIALMSALGCGVSNDPAGNADPNDQYLPQRDTGCQYRGLDTPGVPDIAGRGLTVEFEGSAMDRAAGEVLQSANWTVTIPE